ncbi:MULTISPECIES: hypothetical protein [Marinomonas]|uniref:Uncharacterized protein n=1 Tax=Marinomonas rhodophyticola TaxID=2992803 RepID=A0ABT3KGM5_9GAMM|nr:hypothetical protein [Marinomonas sp. KJ51-3]MCW4629698.1 hypothetical protein [Marinomonas sp. KJ51-3]
MFYWSLPISFGLILSIPLSWLSGGAKRGNVIRYLGLMRAPEEKRPHAIVAMQHKHSVEQKSLQFDASLSSLKRLVSDSKLFYWHLAQMRKDQPNKEFCRAWICAEWQILNSDNIQNLLDHLNEKECLAILEHRELMSIMQKYLPKNERVSEPGEALMGA